HGAEAFWAGLLGGVSGLRPIRRFALPSGAPILGGEVPPIAVADVARSAIGRRIDWVSLLALAACRLALEDAGLDPARLAPARTALGLGSAWGNLRETTVFLDRLFARWCGEPAALPEPRLQCAAQLRVDRARDHGSDGDGRGAGGVGP